MYIWSSVIWDFDSDHCEWRVYFRLGRETEPWGNVLVFSNSNNKQDFWARREKKMEEKTFLVWGSFFDPRQKQKNNMRMKGAVNKRIMKCILGNSVNSLQKIMQFSWIKLKKASWRVIKLFSHSLSLLDVITLQRSATLHSASLGPNLTLFSAVFRRVALQNFFLLSLLLSVFFQFLASMDMGESMTDEKWLRFLSTEGWSCCLLAHSDP